MATDIPYSFQYTLLDFGRGRKLERFGDVVVNRPEVLATGNRNSNENVWNADSVARFEEEGIQSGKWFNSAAMPDQWYIEFKSGHISWRAICKPGRFKHLGLFPEQVRHWQFLVNNVLAGNRVLNLFGYTGAASLTAALCGADVYHVDSSRSVINWAAENARLNNISSIHWVCEDALKFAEKETKRGHKYDFIIMDPPVYGRGKNGEHWKLEELLPNLIKIACSLLSKNGYIILNTYSPVVSLNDMKVLFEKNGLRHNESGWLSVDTGMERKLNLSKFVIAS
jgi:23S rRNA (cytosine1962-C5)-methyltransferase